MGKGAKERAQGMHQRCRLGQDVTLDTVAC